MYNLFRVLQAARADFCSLITSQTIPLDARLEWFLSYGSDFLGISSREELDEYYDTVTAAHIYLESENKSNSEKLEQALKDICKAIREI